MRTTNNFRINLRRTHFYCFTHLLRCSSTRKMSHEGRRQGWSRMVSRCNLRSWMVSVSGCSPMIYNSVIGSNYRISTWLSQNTDAHSTRLSSHKSRLTVVAGLMVRPGPLNGWVMSVVLEVTFFSPKPLKNRIAAALNHSKTKMLSTILEKDGSKCLDITVLLRQRLYEVSASVYFKNWFLKVE